eukprot:62319-Chlamydomonas_euryale.AAC.6
MTSQRRNARPHATAPRVADGAARRISLCVFLSPAAAACSIRPLYLQGGGGRARMRSPARPANAHHPGCAAAAAVALVS